MKKLGRVGLIVDKLGDVFRWILKSRVFVFVLGSGDVVLNEYLVK